MNGLPLSRRIFVAGAAGTVLVPGAIRAGASHEASPAAGDCIPAVVGDRCLPLAPEADRVDLIEPTFTDPTAVTNPLLPVRDLLHAIQLGEEGGDLLRVEVTLLPETNPIDWNGVSVECLAAQYVAWSDGQIGEVAIDFYAQDDGGNVWYFGEDVSNYEDGVIADTEGAWLAGKDGPPGMIMPADPQVGDVFRTENIPGFVFEQVTVQAIGQPVTGPGGPIVGAILVEELQMEGVYEHKVYAPGYGEFQAEAADEFVTVAVGVPIDARAEPAPDALGSLLAGIRACGSAAAGSDWEAAATAFDGVEGDWQSVQDSGMPLLLDEQMSNALDDLSGGIEDEDAGEAGQAAIAAEFAALDCWLLYAPLADVDVGRMIAWTRQVEVDAGKDDAAEALGAVSSLEAVWARSGHTVEPAAAGEMSSGLDDLRAAADAENLGEAATAAASLRETLSGIEMVLG